MPTAPDRYARQKILSVLGPAGQERLAASTVTIVGCGALGTHQAQLLARAGVGCLRLVDRDLVELSNLHRQVLFDEEDAARGLPKAEAAARRLRRVNSAIAIEAHVADANARTIEALVEGADLLLDATDNLETRYVVNDACVRRGTPWVYGGAVGTTGMVLAIRPGVGPCLRCVFREPPPPGMQPTCDMQGVLNATPALVAALQATEAFKLLTGQPPCPDLITLDLWGNGYRSVAVRADPGCPCCVERRFEFLEIAGGSWATSLCGRNAVQVSPARPAELALDVLAAQLAAVAGVKNNGMLLQIDTGTHQLMVFPDGRAIVKGTDDVAVARSLYARFVGT